METILAIEVRTITNITGKQLKYLLIKRGNEQIAINVGEKTYQNVKEMIQKDLESDLPNDVQES